MSRTWLIELLDRELPHLLGHERDRLATLIVEAMPVEQIDAAIKESVDTQLRSWVKPSDRAYATRDISANAAMAVVGALGGEP